MEIPAFIIDNVEKHKNTYNEIDDRPFLQLELPLPTLKKIDNQTTENQMNTVIIIDLFGDNDDGSINIS